MISRSRVRRAGRGIARGELSETNLRDVEEYRSTFDPLLVQTSVRANEALAEGSIRYLVAGRPKRISSIVRKLIREQGRMSVANMGDLVGVRIVVRDIAAQNEAITRLSVEFSPDYRIRDYRDRDNGYRAVHITYRLGGKAVEIQVRTLPQHVWAVESESFNLTVKEGGGPPEIRSYLDDELCSACKAIDEGHDPDLTVGLLFLKRAPISRFLPNVRRLFAEATTGFGRPSADTTYIVVFDSRLAALTRIEPFLRERERAISEYERLGRMLDHERYDVVVLNARTPQAISVTHPNFFPAVKFGSFDAKLPSVTKSR